jgi:hypothetical protein
MLLSKILVTGTGYTALTITDGRRYENLYFEGTGQTANGIFFAGALAFLHVSDLRVNNLDGFGIKIDTVWDSSFYGLSVELCGNSTDYAFSVDSTADTTNMSTFSRIQVEQATAKAIFIDPNTLSCVFSNIHSERATAVAGTTTWHLGGNRCLYNAGRFHALVPADASLLLDSGWTTFTSLSVEGAIPVTVNAWNGTAATLIGWEIIGTLSQFTNQVGQINLYGCKIATLSGMAGGKYRIVGGRITALTPGDCASLVHQLVLEGVVVDTLDTGHANSACQMSDCEIAAVTAMPTVTHLYGCKITGNLTLTSKLLRAANTRFVGNLLWVGATVQALFSSCIIEGTITGWTAPSTGAWIVGERTDHITPASGQPSGYVCTAAGSPGTWKAFGTIA